MNIMTKRLIAAGLGASSLTASAAPIPVNLFVQRCQELGATYNGAAGHRSIAFTFNSYQGGQVNASALMTFEGSDFCVANTTAATIRLKRINNIGLQVRVTFQGDGTGKMKVADTFSDCADRYPDYLLEKLVAQGVVVYDNLKVAIFNNAKNDFCPAFVNKVRDDVIAALGG